MFAYSNLANPAVTHGRHRRLIEEASAAEPNITVEWEEGYLRGEEFISLGVNSRCFKDVAETADSSATADYTDLLTVVKAAIGPGYVAAIEAWLEGRL